jgi:hypothetical protein
MAGNFEKAVKGGTKIKVCREWLCSCTMALVVADMPITACCPQAQVCRTYPSGNPQWGSWRRGGLSNLGIPDQGFDMDHCIQGSDNRPSHDTRRGAERYSEIHLGLASQACD